MVMVIRLITSNTFSIACFRYVRFGKQCTHEYAIPKIKVLCNLHCLKARLRLPYNKYQRRSRLNLISQQLGVSVEYLFGKDDILAKLDRN